MGDRCYVSVQCLQTARAEFEALGLRPEFGTDPNAAVVTLARDEMNYGALMEIEPFAIEGTIFTYAATAGDNYGPILIAAHDGDYQIVDRQGNQGEHPIVSVTDATGALDREELQAAVNYWRILALVQHVFDRAM